MTADGTHAGVFRTLAETPVIARTVLIGIFINQAGTFVQLFLVLFLTVRGFTVAQAGIALGCYSVGAIIGTFAGGSLADLLGPRWTIVTGMGSASVFTLLLTLVHAFPAILVVAALSAAATRASVTATTALLFKLVPRDRQVMMSALSRTAANAGLTIGPLVATALSTISWDLVFWTDSGTSLIYCAIAGLMLPAARMKRDTEALATPVATPEPGARTGYAAMLRDRRYLVYLLLMLFNGLVHIQFFVVLPLMLRAEGYPIWAYGSLTAVSATISVGLQLAVTRQTQKWPIWVAVMSGWLLLVTGYGFFGLPGGLIIFFIAMFIAEVGQLIGGPAAFAHPVRAAPPGAAARYIGSANGVFGLGYALGPVVGVLLWTHIGKGVWLVCVLAGLAMAAPGIWSLRPDSRPAAPQSSPPAQESDGLAGSSTTPASTQPCPQASTGSASTETAS